MHGTMNVKKKGILSLKQRLQDRLFVISANYAVRGIAVWWDDARITYQCQQIRAKSVVEQDEDERC